MRPSSKRHLTSQLAALGCALPLTMGLGDCIDLCDPRTEPACREPTGARVRGVITVPEAGSASAGLQRLGGPFAQAVKTAMLDELARRGRPQAAPRKGRFPQASRRNEPARETKTRAERFRAGEILVKAREPARGRKAELARQIELALDESLGDARGRALGALDVDVRLCGTEHRCLAHVSTADGKPLGLEATAQAAAVLARSPFLLWAERNLILDVTRTPSDEYFTLQWHYAAMELPSAWDITTGSSSVVAAVIDTGILYDHPDLAERVIGTGADLIDDPGIANDGDGRDDDGYDDGDNICGAGCNSYHGTHVAGTMGAETNDGDLVSGVTWAGGLLPVRALGVGGGALSDIADALAWSVGGEVDGVRRNATPADVVNMSLGGFGTSQALNDAVADAVAAGAIVIVAAGNEDVDAAGFTPANAPAAITVAAHGNTGPARSTPRKSSYSNFGDTVDVAAPGGELAEDADGDGQADGVLSTLDDYVSFYQGTSMAAPHVAGIAMLLKSLDRTLTQEDVRRLLTESADPDLDCTGCGAGRVSALGALRALDSGGSELSSPVVPSPSFVRVGAGQAEAVLTFRNFNDEDIPVEFSVGGADRERCALSRRSGTVRASGDLAVTVALDRNAAQDDSGECTVTASAVGGSAEARVVWSGAELQELLEVDVGAVRVFDNGDLRVSDMTTTDASRGYAYTLDGLDAGTYLIIGLADADGNGSYNDPADAIGIYTPPAQDGSICNQASCGRVTLQTDALLRGADFLVAPGFSGGDDDTGGTGDGSLGDACTSGSDCGGGLYCESILPGGSCTTDCLSDADCPDGGACFQLSTESGSAYQICLETCTSDAECRTDEGYICDADSTCFP